MSTRLILSVVFLFFAGVVQLAAKQLGFSISEMNYDLPASWATLVFLFMSLFLFINYLISKIRNKK